MPRVDAVRDDRDFFGDEVDVRGEEIVFVKSVLGKENSLVDEKLATVELVGGDDVVEQARLFGEGGVHRLASEEPRQPGLFDAALDVVPYAPPGDHVGAGPLGGVDQADAGVPVQDVVTVQKHHVPAAGGGYADIARTATGAGILR